jgi:hypothetical protein
MFSLSERINYDILRRLFGGELCVRELARKHRWPAYRHIAAAVAFFALTGAGRLKGGRLVLNARGRYYLVVLMREFFTGVNNLRQTAMAAASS